mmetsp:Transcript_8144/g.11856  ORF Transcript_8144/g.11856 Transcript_8144/m.11856 type:complete len:84 (+) Transcript_8144:31-282(+)
MPTESAVWHLKSLDAICICWGATADKSRLGIHAGAHEFCTHKSPHFEGLSQRCRSDCLLGPNIVLVMSRQGQEKGVGSRPKTP